MLTGFNTDVDYAGRTYHVQTEDRGRNHPLIESLVYCGGEIVASRRNPYSELLDSGKYSEAEVLRLMEEQHRRLIREIHNGKFDTEGLKPFGHNIVTNRSLDEVVVAFLAESFQLEQIQLKMTGPKVLREGASPTLKLEVVERKSERPICGARVVVKLIALGSQPQELFAASTDELGRVEATFEIPRLSAAGSEILCQAAASGRTAEIKRLVKKVESQAG